MAGFDAVDPALYCVPQEIDSALCVMPMHEDCAERPPEDIRASLDQRKLAIQKKILHCQCCRGGQASCVES